MRFYLGYLAALAALFLVPQTGRAESCLAPGGVKTVVHILDGSEEYRPKLNLFSKQERCSTSYRFPKNKGARYKIKLKSGLYNLRVKSKQCETIKKKIKIKGKAKRIKLTLKCQKESAAIDKHLEAINNTFRIIPVFQNKIQLSYVSNFSGSATFHITKAPSHGVIETIGEGGLIVYSVGDSPLNDSISFTVEKDGIRSNEASISLVAPLNGEDILNGIVEQKLTTDEFLSEHIEALTFEEVFNQLDEISITRLLQREGALANNVSAASLLSSKGIDGELHKLCSGGVLTGITSLLGGAYVIPYLGPPKANQELLVAESINSRFRESFLRNKKNFLGSISPSNLKEILFAPKEGTPKKDDILLISNELIPYFLGGNQEDIVRRIAVSLKFETGEKADSWNVKTLASVIRGIEPSKRTFFITFTSGNAVAALDPLVDGSGAIIEKFPGVPHRFPSHAAWGERVKANLGDYLLAIKSEFELLQDFSPPAAYVAIDFESIRNDWESTVLYFQGSHELLLLDPRTEGLKQALSLTDDDIRNMDAWLPADSRRLRWDAYMLKERASVLSDAIGETFRLVFQNPNILASNYDDALRSDLVPNGAFEKKEFRIWGSIGTHLQNGAPSIPLYGLHYHRLSTPEGEILSAPPAPKVIHQVTDQEYYTRSNTFVSTLNRVNSISSASALKTNHYITFKEFIDTWHNGYYGPCLRYNTSTNRYERLACGYSEGIGDFMFEYWALAAQNAKFLNLYTLSTSSLPITQIQAELARRSMTSINRLLGYSDREILNDGVVYINGERRSVGPGRVPYGEPFYVWGAKANSMRVYRVVFMAPNGFDKRSAVLRDGRNGDGVAISYGGSLLEIPGAQIDMDSFSDDASPFGLFVTQPVKAGKLIK